MRPARALCRDGPTDPRSCGSPIEVCGNPVRLTKVPSLLQYQRLAASAEELGASWEEVLDHSASSYKDRATIELFMSKHQCRGTMLIFGENEDGSSTHVFAAEGRHFVDTHTYGKVVEFTHVPPDYNAFHIKRIFDIT